MVCSSANSFLVNYSNCVLTETFCFSNIMPEIHVVCAFLERINAITQRMITAFINIRGNEIINTQDEISRIRRRKRGRNMWNRSGNTTVITRFRCRFGDVYLLLGSQHTTFFTCFRQVPVEGNKYFRKCNFMSTCAKTHGNVPETWLFL